MQCGGGTLDEGNGAPPGSTCLHETYEKSFCWKKPSRWEGVCKLTLRLMTVYAFNAYMGCWNA
jgi:hypothetical protein